MSEKYYIGNQFTKEQIDVICDTLMGREMYRFTGEFSGIDLELEKEYKEENHKIDIAIEIAKNLKKVSSKGSKTELATELDFYKKKSQDQGKEKYYHLKEIKELKELNPQEEIKKVWELHSKLDQENEELRKYKYANDKGKNPLEDELKSIKKDLENTKENLKFYQDKHHENKEIIAELEKPSNLNNEKYYMDYINSEYGNHSGWAEYCAKYPSNDKPTENNELKNPHKKYHENYDKKTYTFFITEDKLDCINKGLELLKKDPNWPVAKKSHDFINERIKKIKCKVKSHLISMNGAENPNLASELANY